MSLTGSPVRRAAPDGASGPDGAHSAPRSRTPVLIGLIGFFTLVDLFAAQAILPTLAGRFAVAPGVIGLAANASTLGMAVAGLAIAFIGARTDRRIATTVSLAILSVPTLLLAVAPDIQTFAALRIAQGVFMVAAFSMTMSYLAERCSAAQATTALAAYVTGSVASNLVGRLVSSFVAESYGVPANFIFFAALNIAGAALAWATLREATPMEVAPLGPYPAQSAAPSSSPAFPASAAFVDHLKNACLRTAFGIGFLVLFAFIGAFTYVNFALAAAPISLSPTAIGYVYFVFAPAMLTTPLAGRVAARYGARNSFLASLGLALAGMAMLLALSLPIILLGLTLVGVGLFFAQATATGFVGRAAKHNRAAASGMYLSAYYLGGLAGAAVLGAVFDRAGWTATVGVAAAAIIAAGALAAMLKKSTAEPGRED